MVKVKVRISVRVMVKARIGLALGWLGSGLGLGLGFSALSHTVSGLGCGAARVHSDIQSGRLPMLLP